MSHAFTADSLQWIGKGLTKTSELIFFGASVAEWKWTCARTLATHAPHTQTGLVSGGLSSGRNDAEFFEKLFSMMSVIGLHMNPE